MFIRNLTLKVLCTSLCIAISTSNSDEETARDFIEHVLRIPNPDKILNSVLGMLEKNRRQMKENQQIAMNADCDDDGQDLPEYTESLQSSQERGLRQLAARQKHYPICNLERTIRKLNTKEYEYRPAYYEEVRCAISSDVSVDIGSSNEICSSLGFSCVQWNKTIHLTRRRYTSDCWETRTMVIPAGCECMWPIHRLGNMQLHI